MLRYCVERLSQLTHMMRMIMVSSISKEQVKLEKLIKKSLYKYGISCYQFLQRTHIILLRGYTNIEKKLFFHLICLSFNINFSYTKFSNHF